MNADKKILASLLIIFFSLGCSTDVQDTTPIKADLASAVRTIDTLDDFKSSIEQDLSSFSNGESILAQIPEVFGRPNTEALVAFNSKDGNQVVFVPVYKDSSTDTEAILLAVNSKNITRYALFARGELYQVSNVFATKENKPNSHLLASIFVSYDRAIFGDDHVNVAEIIGKPNKGEVRSGMAPNNSLNDIKSEWVGYEVCWFMFAGTAEDPYQEFRGIDCYMEYEYVFEIELDPTVLLDYTSGGGGGGGSSIGLSFVDKIDFSLLKPCMQDVFNDIKNISSGIDFVIHKFSGSKPQSGYNWTLEHGNLGEENAITAYPYDNASESVRTTFDTNKFKNASELSIARTILHESVHAYLIAEFKFNRQSFSSNYSRLIDLYGSTKYGSLNDAQHADYYNSWISGIAMSLQEYGYSKGLDLPYQYYLDLAWGGVTHRHAKDAQGNLLYDQYGNPVWELSESFKNAVPNASDRNRILNNISIEQSGFDLNGDVKTQKSEKSGC